MFKHLLLFALLFAPIQALPDQAQEPPFPTLFDSTETRPLVHIIGEYRNEDQTNGVSSEEYIDLFRGKMALIETGANFKQTTFIDANSGLYIHYKPFTCNVYEISQGSPDKGLWQAESIINVDGNVRSMQFYGIAALWINAQNRPKVYTRENRKFVMSKNNFDQAHAWAIKEGNSIYTLYFVEDEYGDFYLDSIEETDNEMRVVQIVDILTFERDFPEEVHDNLLQIPVGYGCQHTSLVVDNLKYSYNERLYSSYHFQHVLTAVKYPEPGSNAEAIRKEATVEHLNDNGMKQILRIRDKSSDIKVIYDLIAAVAYIIDVKQGTCNVATMADVDKLKPEKSHIIRFEDELDIELSQMLLHELFGTSDGFVLTKQIDLIQDSVSRMYLEKANSHVSDRKSRIVRRYTAPKRGGRAELEAVTLWILDDAEQRILKSYNFDVMDIRDKPSVAEMARLFDRSEECFINDKTKRAGVDYAWFEASYPMMTRDAKLISKYTKTFIEHIYSQFKLSNYLDYLRTPRLELIVDETLLTMRFLVLDQPPIELMFRPVQDTALMVDPEFPSTEKNMASDLHHCAELCKINKCYSFSFCDKRHECLTSPSVTLNGNKRSMQVKGCTTYLAPLVVSQGPYVFSLRKFIDDVQDTDFVDIPMPAMPEELILPRTEVDPDARAEAHNSYWNNVSRILNSRGPAIRLLTLTASLGDNFVLLAPNRVAIDRDTLAQVSDSEENSLLDLDLNQAGSSFVEGPPEWKYRMDRLAEDNIRHTLYPKVPYEHCALACIDNNCKSFSYCAISQECLITDIETPTSKYLEGSNDCMIAQRNYLSKFNQFKNTYRPVHYEEAASASKPADCAMHCVESTGYKCLAFDFCAPTKDDSTAFYKCYYQTSRRVYSGPQNIEEQRKEIANKDTQCSHYSRTFLADFIQADSKEIVESYLEKYGAVSLAGKTVDQCADYCVNNLADCSAFQFCFSSIENQPIATQRCTLIEGNLPKEEEEARLVVDETNHQVIEAGKMFKSSPWCSVFTLRKQTNEARNRDTAIEAETKQELIEWSRENGKSSPGITVGGALLLFICLSLASTALVCGLIVASDKTDFLSQRFDRLKLYFGRY